MLKEISEYFEDSDEMDIMISIGISLNENLEFFVDEIKKHLENRCKYRKKGYKIHYITRYTCPACSYNSIYFWEAAFHMDYSACTKKLRAWNYGYPIAKNSQWNGNAIFVLERRKSLLAKIKRIIRRIVLQ